MGKGGGERTGGLIGSGRGGRDEPAAVVQEIPGAARVGVVHHVPIRIDGEGEAGRADWRQGRRAVKDHEARGTCAVEDLRWRVVDRHIHRLLVEAEQDGVQRHFLHRHRGDESLDARFQLDGLIGVERGEFRREHCRGGEGHELRVEIDLGRTLEFDRADDCLGGAWRRDGNRRTRPQHRPVGPFDGLRLVDGDGGAVHSHGMRPACDRRGRCPGGLCEGR